jgi:hypothetical protein
MIYITSGAPGFRMGLHPDKATVSQKFITSDCGASELSNTVHCSYWWFPLVMAGLTEAAGTVGNNGADRFQFLLHP